MEGFGKFVGYLLLAIPVIGAIYAIILAVQLVIAFWPIIVGVGVLLFLGYVLCVGFIHLGDDKTK